MKKLTDIASNCRKFDISKYFIIRWCEKWIVQYEHGNKSGNCNLHGHLWQYNCTPSSRKTLKNVQRIEHWTNLFDFGFAIIFTRSRRGKKLHRKIVWNTKFKIDTSIVYHFITIIKVFIVRYTIVLLTIIECISVRVLSVYKIITTVENHKQYDEK